MAASPLLFMPHATPDPLPTFAELVGSFGRDLPLDLALACIAAEEQPEVEVAHCLSIFDDIADAVHMPAGASIYEAVARINHQLFTVLGIEGDTETYDHPDNSLVNRVWARRRGLPILLSVLYVEVARRLDVDLCGVAFPAHYVVGTRSADPRFFIDPFYKGQIMRDADLRDRLQRLTGASHVEPETWARFTEPATNAATLLRVNTNLKRSWTRRGDLAGALRAIERNLALDPDCLVEHRDRGVVLAKLGQVTEARAELGLYLAREPEAWDAAYIRKLVTDLAS